MDILTTIDIVEGTIRLLHEMPDDYTNLNAIIEVLNLSLLFTNFKQFYFVRYREMILKNIM